MSNENNTYKIDHIWVSTIAIGDDSSSCISQKNKHKISTEEWYKHVISSSEKYKEKYSESKLDDTFIEEIKRLSDDFPYPEKKDLFTKLTNTIQLHISEDGNRNSATTLTSAYSLILVFPQIPKNINRLYIDEDSGYIGVNLKIEKSVLNITIKGNGEFIYSAAIKGQSLSSITGKATIRNPQDSKHINKIFGMITSK